MQRKQKDKSFFPLILYFGCIIYITIISRSPALAHTVRITPLWSYLDWLKGNWSRGTQILLNIVLFVPLGFLLEKQKTTGCIPNVVSLFVSVAIEIIQYLTYRGYFDIDDIISNFIGGLVGYLCHRRFRTKLNEWIPYTVIIIAGVTGCVLTVRNTQVYETQFDFQITSAEINEEQISLTGICNIYRRDNLPYQIFFKDMNTDYPAETIISEKGFTATAEIPSERYYEVDVVFQGYKPISTGTFIENGEVLYVQNAPIPETNSIGIQRIIDQGVLKAYNADFDVYIYQVDDHLYWIVGSNTDAGMIYQLHTDEPENLPEDRKQYGFDNRGFMSSDETKLMPEISNGRYRIFMDYIPSDYHVTAIMVGILKVKGHCHIDSAVPPPANRIRVNVRFDIDLKVCQEGKAILPPEAHAGVYPAVTHRHAVLGEVGNIEVHGKIAVVHALSDLFDDASGIVAEDVGIALGDRREGNGKGFVSVHR